MTAPTGYKKLSGDFTFTVGKDGNLTYTTVPEGVTVTKGDDGVWQIKVVNTEATTYSVEKVWKDAAKTDYRPDSVTVQLYADDVSMGDSYQKTLTETNNWSATWSDLPKYSATATSTDDKVVYTAREVKVGDGDVNANTNTASANGFTYAITYDNTDTSKTVITNTLTNKTSVYVQKNWELEDGDWPTGVTVTMTLKKGDTVLGSVDLTSNEKKAITDLPMYDADGAVIDYTTCTVVETVKYNGTECAITDGVFTANGVKYAAGSVSGQGTSTKPYTITNTQAGRTGSIQIPVQKTVKGYFINESRKFTFTLTADEGNPEGATLPNPATLDISTYNTQTDSFDAITFTKEGTYTFTVTETKIMVDDK